jgi:hypothetical protein
MFRKKQKSRKKDIEINIFDVQSKNKNRINIFDVEMTQQLYVDLASHITLCKDLLLFR